MNSTEWESFALPLWFLMALTLPKQPSHLFLVWWEIKSKGVKESLYFPCKATVRRTQLMNFIHTLSKAVIYSIMWIQTSYLHCTGMTLKKEIIKQPLRVWVPTLTFQPHHLSLPYQKKPTNINLQGSYTIITQLIAERKYLCFIIFLSPRQLNQIWLMYNLLSTHIFQT